MLASQTIYLRGTNNSWRALEPGGVGNYRPFFSRIVSAADGSIVVMHSSGLSRYQNGQWTPISVYPRVYGLRHLVLGPPGKLIVTKGKELGLVPANGGRVDWRPAFASIISDVAADRSGRIWVSTETGLRIIERNGHVVEVGAGQVLELAGRISGLAVVGRGPRPPKLGPPKTGSIRGQVFRFGSPLAFAVVELCRAPKLFHRVSPCSDERSQRRAKTGADGGFLFENVPIADYRFAVRIEGRWRLAYRPCCGAMQPGQTFHVGSLNFNR